MSLKELIRTIYGNILPKGVEHANTHADNLIAMFQDQQSDHVKKALEEFSKWANDNRILLSQKAVGRLVGFAVQHPTLSSSGGRTEKRLIAAMSKDQPADLEATLKLWKALQTPIGEGIRADGQRVVHMPLKGFTIFVWYIIANAPKMRAAAQEAAKKVGEGLGIKLEGEAWPEMILCACSLNTLSDFQSLTAYSETQHKALMEMRKRMITRSSEKRRAVPGGASDF